MRFILVLLVLICLLKNDTCYCQAYNPFPEAIQMKKKSIIPIIGVDSTFKNKFTHLGTGFMVSLDTTNYCIVFVTCEHVVTIKDSITNKTIRNVQGLYANLNLANDSILSVPLKIKYLDEKNDFAILEIEIPDESVRRRYNYNILLSLYQSVI